MANNNYLDNVLFAIPENNILYEQWKSEKHPREKSGQFAHKYNQIKEFTNIKDIHTNDIIKNIPINLINVNPHKFQYKGNFDPETGHTNIPKQKFDPKKAGIISVWKDPKDGKIYVINGHHRLQWAKESGYKTLPLVNFINVRNEQEAIVFGAIQNVVEGDATVGDAVLLFKKLRLTPIHLIHLGMPGNITTLISPYLKQGVELSGQNIKQLQSRISESLRNNNSTTNKNNDGSNIRNRENQESDIWKDPTRKFSVEKFVLNEKLYNSYLLQDQQENWREQEHPRDPHTGKFIDKLKQMILDNKLASIASGIFGTLAIMLLLRRKKITKFQAATAIKEAEKNIPSPTVLKQEVPTSLENLFKKEEQIILTPETKVIVNGIDINKDIEKVLIKLPEAEKVLDKKELEILKKEITQEPIIPKLPEALPEKPISKELMPDETIEELLKKKEAEELLKKKEAEELLKKKEAEELLKKKEIIPKDVTASLIKKSGEVEGNIKELWITTVTSGSLLEKEKLSKDLVIWFKGEYPLNKYPAIAVDKIFDPFAKNYSKNGLPVPNIQINYIVEKPINKLAEKIKDNIRFKNKKRMEDWNSFNFFDDYKVGTEKTSKTKPVWNEILKRTEEKTTYHTTYKVKFFKGVDKVIDEHRTSTKKIYRWDTITKDIYEEFIALQKECESISPDIIKSMLSNNAKEILTKKLYLKITDGEFVDLLKGLLPDSFDKKRLDYLYYNYMKNADNTFDFRFSTLNNPDIISILPDYTNWFNLFISGYGDIAGSQINKDLIENILNKATKSIGTPEESFWINFLSKKSKTPNLRQIEKIRNLRKRIEDTLIKHEEIDVMIEEQNLSKWFEREKTNYIPPELREIFELRTDYTGNYKEVLSNFNKEVIAQNKWWEDKIKPKIDSAIASEYDLAIAHEINDAEIDLIKNNRFDPEFLTKLKQAEIHNLRVRISGILEKAKKRIEETMPIFLEGKPTKKQIEKFKEDRIKNTFDDSIILNTDDLEREAILQFDKENIPRDVYNEIAEVVNSLTKREDGSFDFSNIKATLSLMQPEYKKYFKRFLDKFENNLEYKLYKSELFFKKIERARVPFKYANINRKKEIEIIKEQVDDEVENLIKTTGLTKIEAQTIRDQFIAQRTIDLDNFIIKVNELKEALKDTSRPEGLFDLPNYIYKNILKKESRPKYTFTLPEIPFYINHVTNVLNHISGDLLRPKPKVEVIQKLFDIVKSHSEEIPGITNKANFNNFFDESIKKYNKLLLKNSIDKIRLVIPIKTNNLEGFLKSFDDEVFTYHQKLIAEGNVDGFYDHTKYLEFQKYIRNLFKDYNFSATKTMDAVDVNREVESCLYSLLNNTSAWNAGIRNEIPFIEKQIPIDDLFKLALTRNGNLTRDRFDLIFNTILKSVDLGIKEEYKIKNANSIIDILREETSRLTKSFGKQVDIIEKLKLPKEEETKQILEAEKQFLISNPELQLKLQLLDNPEFKIKLSKIVNNVSGIDKTSEELTKELELISDIEKTYPELFISISDTIVKNNMKLKTRVNKIYREENNLVVVKKRSPKDIVPLPSVIGAGQSKGLKGSPIYSPVDLTKKYDPKLYPDPEFAPIQEILYNPEYTKRTQTKKGIKKTLTLAGWKELHPTLKQSLGRDASAINQEEIKATVSEIKRRTNKTIDRDAEIAKVEKSLKARYDKKELSTKTPEEIKEIKKEIKQKLREETERIDAQIKINNNLKKQIDHVDIAVTHTRLKNAESELAEVHSKISRVKKLKNEQQIKGSKIYDIQKTENNLREEYDLLDKYNDTFDDLVEVRKQIKESQITKPDKKDNLTYKKHQAKEQLLHKKKMKLVDNLHEFIRRVGKYIDPKINYTIKSGEINDDYMQILKKELEHNLNPKLNKIKTQLDDQQKLTNNLNAEVKVINSEISKDIVSKKKIDEVNKTYNAIYEELRKKIKFMIPDQDNFTPTEVLKVINNITKKPKEELIRFMNYSKMFKKVGSSENVNVISKDDLISEIINIGFNA